jgi:hypothetical protein
MIIKFEYPPNYEAITKAFDLTGYKTIFAWDSYIYNPHHIPIGPQLMAHETVHGTRQLGDPERWWNLYLADEKFRLSEEIVAHVAEYFVLCQGKTRNDRRGQLDYVAKRLCAPIYNYKPPLTLERAKRLLKEAIRGPVTHDR